MGATRAMGDEVAQGRRPGKGDDHAQAVDPRRVTVLQEWRCLVEDIGPETMCVRMADVTCPSNEEEWGEIPLERIPADLLAEIEFGAIFRLLVVQDAALATSVVLAPLVGPSVPDDTGARLAELLAGIPAVQRSTMWVGRPGSRENGYDELGETDRMGVHGKAGDVGMRGDTWWPTIVTDSETMSGEPCVEGTRIHVETVLANLRAGHSAEAITAAYPTLPAGGIEAAIAWAEGNGIEWRPAGGAMAP